MDTKRWIIPNALAIAGVSVLLLVLTGCGFGQTPEPTSTIAAPTDTPAPVPTLSFNDTSMKNFTITDFDAVHAPVNGDTNKYLIFGRVPVSKPAENLPPELAVFLGRWEGIDQMMIKSVMVVQEINEREGKALNWAAHDLQNPYEIAEIHFRVVMGSSPIIEWRANIEVGEGQYEDVVFSYSYDRSKDMLEGWIKSLGTNQFSFGPIHCSRNQSYFVYKDYSRYLVERDAISSTDFEIKDFEAVHSPVVNDPYAYLIFGNIPVTPPAQDLSPELAAYLGRWEGYDYSPPVKKDNKGVLFIQEISPQGGKAFLWAGTNLQYPYWIKEIHFRVVPGAVPSIEWESDLSGLSGAGGTGTFRFAYDPENQLLKGGINVPSGSELDGPTIFSRDQSFVVYKDYEEYLAGKGISAKEYQTQDLQEYGKGYMVYLPEGYEENPTQAWPMIFFLHGAGDRGDNINLLAKASPFMMIREKGPLPFIIVAPLLTASKSAFPIEYLDGVLAEMQATYRIDPKRIYVTGLSLGGEATYRFAIQHPDTFAAIAPLSAWLDADQIALLDRIKNLPVWAIHGADDSIIPLSLGQAPADALEKLGGNIRFTVLEGHDHDTWTDTYSDPAFYDWFLQHTRS